MKSRQDCEREDEAVPHEVQLQRIIDGLYLTREIDAKTIATLQAENAEQAERIKALETLLREAYGYTTAANDLLPERIKAALEVGR